MERSKEKLSGDFVLDSSVIVKWFCQEEDTELALEFREGYVNGYVNIAFPDLVIYEIANALRYNQNLRLAFEYDITLYDAYFVALAKELGFKFVTADGNFYKKIKELKFVRLLKNIWIK